MDPFTLLSDDEQVEMDVILYDAFTNELKNEPKSFRDPGFRFHYNLIFSGLLLSLISCKNYRSDWFHLTERYFRQVLPFVSVTWNLL